AGSTSPRRHPRIRPIVLAGGGAMAYRVDYNGEDIELATLDAALNCARNAIANDVDRFDGWAVDHDEDVEDWERRVSFVGQTPAEAFAMAADWLERHPDIIALGDIGWHHTPTGHQLR